MQPPRADAIDTGAVFGIYAVLACLGGTILLVWGYVWLGACVNFQCLGKAALIRFLASILIAAGCFAAALRSADPPSRQRGLLWFSAGHAVVWASFPSLRSFDPFQREPVWESNFVDLAATVLFATWLLFFYFWQTAEGEGPPQNKPLSIVNQSSTERLRSQYEEQIRRAARQEERHSLARDLHDSVKQQLFVIQTAAATVQARFGVDDPGAKEALGQVRSSAREAMTEMEVMLDQLQAAPLENVGLVEALKKQCESLRLRTGAKVDFSVGRLPPSEVLAPGTQQAIFRVAQEALANVGRHARAKNVSVILSDEGAQVRLTVRDDGAGYDPNRNSRGMGVANMRARAEEVGGKLELQQIPAGGTSVRLSIPYAAVPLPSEYRTRALSWGALTILSVSWSVWKMSLLAAPWALFGAVAFTRSLYAYLRVRKQAEARR